MPTNVNQLQLIYPVYRRQQKPQVTSKKAKIACSVQHRSPCLLPRPSGKRHIFSYITCPQIRPKPCIWKADWRKEDLSLTGSAGEEGVGKKKYPQPVAREPSMLYTQLYFCFSLPPFSSTCKGRNCYYYCNVIITCTLISCNGIGGGGGVCCMYTKIQYNITFGAPSSGQLVLGILQECQLVWTPQATIGAEGAFGCYWI